MLGEHGYFRKHQHEEGVAAETLVIEFQLFGNKQEPIDAALAAASALPGFKKLGEDRFRVADAGQAEKLLVKYGFEDDAKLPRDYASRPET